MLISRKVVQMNNERDQKIEEVREENRIIYEKLNPIQKIRLNRINNLIYQLSSMIENLSGWTYAPYSFINKSNYQYDPKLDEITFVITKIERKNDGYQQPDNPSSYTINFLNTYREQLDKLFILEQKREKILEPYKQDNHIINFKTELSKKHKKDGVEGEMDYLSIASYQFINRYGIDGIKRLLSLLNELASTSSTDSLEIYNNQFKGNVTNLYVDELFRWAAAFTPKAEYVRNAIEKRKEALEQELTPELRELIR